MIVLIKNLKYFLTAIILIFIFFINISWSTQITVTRPIKNITITGIGVLVNNRDVVTSFSSVQNCKQVSIMSDAKIYQAKLLSYLEVTKGNLALIRTNLNSSHFALLELSNANSQQQIFVSDIKEDLKTFREIDATINFVGNNNYGIGFENKSVKKGNSGSPIYNEKGYMVGILTGTLSSDSEEEYTSATSIKSIQKFAKTHNIELSKPDFYGNDLKLKQGFFDNFAVNISCFNKDENGVLEKIGSFGTGVFVNPNDVITNAHVVKNCNEITVSTKNESYQGKLLAVLPEKQGDLAFIKTSANRTNYALFQDENLFIGQKIFFPAFTSQNGVFKKEESEVRFFGNKNHGIEILLPEESEVIFGSPVFDEKGDLLAIMAMNLNYNSQENLVIATPASVLKDFALKNGVPLYRRNGTILTRNFEERAKSLVKIICE